MATFTFDRPIVINDEESRKRLEDFINSDKPVKKLAISDFSDTERRRSEELLSQYYYRSKI